MLSLLTWPERSTVLPGLPALERLSERFVPEALRFVLREMNSTIQLIELQAERQRRRTIDLRLKFDMPPLFRCFKNAE